MHRSAIPTKRRKVFEDFHHYLPISDELMHGGFYVTSAGRGLIHPGEAYPKTQHPELYDFTWADGRTLPEFSLILIAGGEGLFESRETGPVALRAGDVFLLFPGIWHRYRPTPGTGWTEKWVQFNGPLTYQLLNQGILSPARPIIRPANFKAAEATLDRVLDKVHADPVSNSLLLSLQVMGALATVLADVQVPSTPTGPADTRQVGDPVVIAAIDFIWTRGHHALTVPDVAAAVGVTRRTLERRIMFALGHTPLEEIVRCRFSRAERLLRATDLPIKSVITLSGFGSLENMRQVFVTRTGMSPGVYREHHRPDLAGLRTAGVRVPG